MYSDIRDRRTMRPAGGQVRENVLRGTLIPRPSSRVERMAPEPSFTPKSVQTRRRNRSRRPVAVVAAGLLMILGMTSGIGFSLLSGKALVAAPVVMLRGLNAEDQKPFTYGVQPLLSQPEFFEETKEAFLEQEMSFIEADLTTMRLYYHNEGKEVFSAPILSKGKEGSWWETPAGLYAITDKQEREFSSFGQVYTPWNMSFQENFFIHGWPVFGDGTPVPEDYSGGCIRLSDEDAKALYALISVDTPVIVHADALASDGFQYEPKIPTLKAPHYLVADVMSGDVLASSDMGAVVPIASITKLMTALVAAEYLNLDRTVRVTQERYVDSIVPRLEGRNSVSMYSLLQLLLVESSNEAAEVIAAQLGRDVFIARMNEKADSIGLRDTVFADPSGLDNNNVSSSSDLFKLLQYIYHNRRFILELTANQDLPTAYISGEFGQLENFNAIEEIDNFLGGKVGETLAAGQTSASLHSFTIKGEERIIAVVVLGSEDRDRDVKELLEYIDERFTP